MRRTRIWLLCWCSKWMPGVPHLSPNWGQWGTSYWDRKMEFLLWKCNSFRSADLDLQLSRECFPMRRISKFVWIRGVWKDSWWLLDNICPDWHMLRVFYSHSRNKIVRNYSPWHKKLTHETSLMKNFLYFDFETQIRKKIKKENKLDTQYSLDM